MSVIGVTDLVILEISHLVSVLSEVSRERSNIRERARNVDDLIILVDEK
jgi:hypothetical protein